MFNLLQFYDLSLFQCFERYRLSVQKSQVDLAESSSTNDFEQLVVSNLSVDILDRSSL